jgi:hypothetical protein
VFEVETFSIVLLQSFDGRMSWYSSHVKQQYPSHSTNFQKHEIQKSKKIEKYFTIK